MRSSDIETPEPLSFFRFCITAIFSFLHLNLTIIARSLIVEKLPTLCAMSILFLTFTPSLFSIKLTTFSSLSVCVSFLSVFQTS